MKPFINPPAIAKSEMRPAPKLTPVFKPRAALEFVSFSRRNETCWQARTAYAQTMSLVSQNGPQALDIYF
ncbi:MAG: hypothetical protein DHS20C04_10970 [Hyphococcus sp.]|nr:MAG: hypothetical protein DHS20C04_10970 [Marinicaulis sp.]